MTAIFGVPEGRQRRPSAAGVKAHIGVYKVHDSHLLSKLLQGHETKEGDVQRLNVAYALVNLFTLRHPLSRLA